MYSIFYALGIDGRLDASFSSTAILNKCSYAAAIRSCVNSRKTRLWPFRPIAAARSGSSIRYPIFAAMSRGSPGSNSKPVSPSITTSGNPPRALATTGKAKAAASAATIPNGSSTSWARRQYRNSDRFPIILLCNPATHRVQQCEASARRFSDSINCGCPSPKICSVTRAFRASRRATASKS